MIAAFHLITEMRLTIASLYEKLCTSDARNVDLEAQNRTLVEQLKMRTAECEAHAQRCRAAENITELTNLEATRRLTVQAAEHTGQRSALWRA